MEKIKILNEDLIIMVILRSIDGNKVKFYGEITSTDNLNYVDKVGVMFESDFMDSDEYNYL